MMNTLPKLIFVALIFGLAIISCGKTSSSKEQGDVKAAEFDLNESKLKIQQITKRFTDAHISKDTSFLNNIFTEDARVLPPNSDIVVGRNAISRLNTDWVNYGIYEFTESSASFYGNQDYLIDEGTYYLRYGEKNTIDKGKYINIWKNVNGEWKLYSNIWNTSLPGETVIIE